MTRFMQRSRIRLFHYKTERLAQRLILRLQRLYPLVTFTARVRENWRYYVWAQYPDGSGGWVQRKTQRALTAVLPDAYNQNLLAEQEADSTKE